jgi:hypothetical protein
MQEQLKHSPQSAESQFANQAESGPRRRETVRLWRAVAGMALSIALACAIVVLESSGQAAHHVGRLQARIRVLLSRLYKTQAEVASERQRLAALQQELASSETLRTVLLAPDLAVMRLAALTAAARRSAGTVKGPGALLAFSPKQHRAMLRVTGLPAPPKDKTFVLWWSAIHGEPAKAVEFVTTPPDGRALLLVALPPAFNPAAAMVTIENAGAAGTAPSNSVQLRGSLRR